MKSSNREEPPAAENSRATKRKHSLKSKQFDRGNKHAKRQRLTVSETLTISETETQTTFTLKPDPSRNPPTSNRFEPIRSSRKRNKTRKRRKSSATDECHRQWTFSSRDFSNFKDKFVVVSYNILGVENALKHPDLYMDVPPEFLEWERRKRLIREEIKRYNASILCFQEVDRFDDLDYLLRKDGFKGVYKARTGDARDGCAIFWKDKLFTLLHQENVEFQKFGLRHNVAQFCVLKVRLYLEKAYKLSQEWSKIPVLLAGDLNSSPQSAIYQFLASSKLDVQQHDRRYMSRQVEFSSNCRDFKFQNGCRNRGWMSISRPLIYGWSDEELRLATGSKQVTQLQHQLKLHSAYFGIPGSRKTRDNNGEPLATSYHSKFMGTVDYIWHTEELLPVRVLETLPIDILKGSAGLPCEFLQEIIFFQKLKCDLGKIEEVSSSEETG
ncbi:carbon catabolite repressor protein 4 homolog 5 isoform X6 [Pistacia vera]|uniref:carbon catabolite repressor protein 4 homolog 5 isoform X6 n=1 Tax=Pistacia vera TaxID=55513 RepID=UPI0012639064|nr:carbon catabolite repressor protein 4 homolog 5 isoform X6 [Pistacia vera]